MTLHWWMHWFWVTTLIILYASYGTLGAPQSEELQHITTDTEIEPRSSERQSRAMYYTKPPISTTTPPFNLTEIELRPSDRQGRAMYYTKTPIITTTPPSNITENQTDNADHADVPPEVHNTTTNITEVPTITWTPISAAELLNATSSNDTVTNITDTQNVTFTAKKRNLTRPDIVKGDAVDGVSESKIVTEKPLSLETTFVQTRIPPNSESSRRVLDQGDDGMDTGAIAGISFAALVLVALAGSTAFVLYRRRYLNKPQTLNDKCSNPDSSGYLDDSTIRDNSEEMYSLDNDSFLNSLEAMTIQNYWTDTVKHTKL